jgi:hypothetical protein
MSSDGEYERSQGRGLKALLRDDFGVIILDVLMPGVGAH